MNDDETDNEKENTNEDIFIKPNKNIDMSKITTKSKLDYLQDMSKEINIDITKGKTKTGKPKYKTKAELCEEIKENNVL